MSDLLLIDVAALRGESVSAAIDRGRELILFGQGGLDVEDVRALLEYVQRLERRVDMLELARFGWSYTAGLVADDRYTTAEERKDFLGRLSAAVKAEDAELEVTA